MIKLFEKYEKKKYIIGADYVHGLIVNVQMYDTPNGVSELQYIEYIERDYNDIIMYYTFEEGKKKVKELNNRYYDYTFKLLPGDYIEILKNTKKYNL